jgi:hypothetical protein
MKLYGKRKTWSTPVSHLVPLAFASLEDAEQFAIVVHQEGSSDRLFFRWNELIAYRCTKEEHGLPWEFNASELKSAGCTHFVDDSPWIAQLRDGNDLFDLLAHNAVHFVILTTTYVVEVISNEQPVVICKKV